MATRTTRRSNTITRWGQHDHEVLVLQGGGALGAYQAGAYAALARGRDGARLGGGRLDRRDQCGADHR